MWESFPDFFLLLLNKADLAVISGGRQRVETVGQVSGIDSLLSGKSSRDRIEHIYQAIAYGRV